MITNVSWSLMDLLGRALEKQDFNFFQMQPSLN